MAQHTRTRVLGVLTAYIHTGKFRPAGEIRLKLINQIPFLV